MLAYLDVFRFIPGYHAHITAAGKEPLFLLLIAFLVTFALTRLYTRVARIRDWRSGSVGGVHLHHMVIGIVLVLLAGLAAVASGADSRGHVRDVIGIVFGVGAAFVLDEFALSLYLRDVYWLPEGRTSIDASLLGITVAGLLLVGVSPFGTDHTVVAGRWAAVGVIALNLLCAVVTLLKGKVLLGLIGLFVPVMGLITAVRLGKPMSLWARRFYGAPKMESARARFAPTARLQRLNRWFADLVGGAPTPVDDPSEN